MQLTEPYTPPSAPPLDVSVIVPTYCEADNLGILIPKIATEFERAGFRGEIIVVDDNSPDQTRAICNQLAETFPLRLLVRQGERGLSSAVIHGMQQATGNVLVVMDADLSHPPEKIAELLEAHADGADFVIGSRYVSGGGVEGGWGLFRWLNSKVATWLAWPLTSARDPMAGFFAIERSTFQSASNLDPVGYKIGLELMTKCACRQVREVPIFFRDRLHGTSKLTLREQINYLRHLKRLYEFKYTQLTRPALFLLVGSTGMIVDLLSLFLLLHLLPLLAARAVAIWIAMSWNFWLNRRLTFSYARSRPIAPQYVMFCASCLVGAVVNWLVSIGLCSTFEFFADWKLLAAFCGIVAGTVFNYVMSSRFVFKPSH